MHVTGGNSRQVEKRALPPQQNIVNRLSDVSMWTAEHEQAASSAHAYESKCASSGMHGNRHDPLQRVNESMYALSRCARANMSRNENRRLSFF